MRRPNPFRSSSDEEKLSKNKKKVKSKSKKRYSSDSDNESRSPKKRSKSKNLVSKKKKKDNKKSEKKRRKKNKRYSRSEYSTCSDSNKSSSPVRKSKKRKREKEIGRKKLRVSETKRRRHRFSSNCSTCSESIRSWSSRPNQIEENFENRHGLSPEDNFEGKIPSDERMQSSYRQNPFDERFEANYNNGFESGDGQSLLDDRHGISYRRSPIKDRFESNFVQSSIEENFESRYRNNLNEMGGRRLRSVVVVKSVTEYVDMISETCDENPSFRRDEIYDERSKKSDLEMEFEEKVKVTAVVEGKEMEHKEKVKVTAVVEGKEMEHKEKVNVTAVVEGKEKEAVDLELILRQKALENLKKFRAARPIKAQSHNEKKYEMSKDEELGQSLHTAEKKSQSKSSSSIVDQSTKLKGSSVVNITREKIFKSAVHNLSNESAPKGQIDMPILSENTLNTSKTMQESSNSKENQNKSIVAQTVGSEANETEANMVPSSVAQNTEALKSVAQSASGSQFEQKTFSRMRDGETVEVKYKVYIPKKTPALARRKLQR